MQADGLLDVVVALLVSAWIEITYNPSNISFVQVALLVSAWIEIGTAV